MLQSIWDFSSFIRCLLDIHASIVFTEDEFALLNRPATVETDANVVDSGEISDTASVDSSWAMVDGVDLPPIASEQAVTTVAEDYAPSSSSVQGRHDVACNTSVRSACEVNVAHRNDHEPSLIPRWLLLCIHISRHAQKAMHIPVDEFVCDTALFDKIRVAYWQEKSGWQSWFWWIGVKRVSFTRVCSALGFVMITE